MDYEKIIKYLLVGCPENCANCDYSEHTEFNCTIDKVAADTILELLIENKILNKRNSDLLTRAEAAEARLEQVKQERDAAIFDLEKAEENAKETYVLLDREIQPVFDYSVYTAIHDSITDIINWEKDSIWRKKEE